MHCFKVSITFTEYFSFARPCSCADRDNVCFASYTQYRVACLNREDAEPMNSKHLSV